MSRSWVAERTLAARVAGPVLAALLALAVGALGCDDQSEAPVDPVAPEVTQFTTAPLPPVPGASTTLSVTGRGLFHGVVRQGDVVVYRFVNATDMFTGTFTATSAAPPELTVEGSDGTIIRRTAGQ
jgi:hypothetical protein